MLVIDPAAQVRKTVRKLLNETILHKEWHGGTVVSTAASQHQGLGFNSSLGLLPVWSLHILPMSLWVSSGCSGFLPQSKDVLVKLIGHAKFPI